MACLRWLGSAGLSMLQPPSGPQGCLDQPGNGSPITRLTSVFSPSHLLCYVFSFNKAFVPTALELGRRLKEHVVILSKVWAYRAELSWGERNHWASVDEELDPLPLCFWTMTGFCSWRFQ